MTEETQKTKISTTVRIWTEEKERLKKIARKVADKEDRDVTELELASEAISEYCNKREKKLGI